jgi:hypothetical protein
MNPDYVEIPLERLPSVANEQSSSSKSVAGVLLFLCAVAILSAIGMATDGNAEPGDTASESASAGARIGGALFGLLIFAGLPARYGIRAARNASRATRAAKIVATDPSYTWRLSGKDVLASDSTGMPHPEVSFTVNGKLRKALLHVPRASVVV